MFHQIRAALERIIDFFQKNYNYGSLYRIDKLEGLVTWVKK